MQTNDWFPMGIEALCGYIANLLITLLVLVVGISGVFCYLFVCFCFQHDLCGPPGLGTSLSVKKLTLLLITFAFGFL